MPSVWSGRVAHIIEPHRGVGQVSLGAHRDELRRLLGPPEYSDSSKDFFFEASLHAHFSPLGTLVCIVVAPGPFVATYEGINLLEVEAELALAIVARNGRVDLTDPEYPRSCTFRSLGLNLWRSCLPADDPSGDAGRRFEAVGVGAVGYFGGWS